MKSLFTLELYILDGAPDSQQALFVINEIKKELGERCKCDVINVFKEPQKALQAGILVTPTLIRKEPTPQKRIIGRLHDKEQIISTLGLHS